MEGAFHLALVPQLLKAKTSGGWISLAGKIKVYWECDLLFGKQN